MGRGQKAPKKMRKGETEKQKGKDLKAEREEETEEGAFTHNGLGLRQNQVPAGNQEERVV